MKAIYKSINESNIYIALFIIKQFQIISNPSLKHIDLIVSKHVSVASNEINSFGILVLEFSSKCQCEKIMTS